MDFSRQHKSVTSKSVQTEVGFLIACPTPPVLLEQQLAGLLSPHKVLENGPGKDMSITCFLTGLKADPLPQSRNNPVMV